MVLGKLPVPGRPTILITVGQGPIALAVGAGGVVWTFLLSSILSPLSPSLWETARYRLKYCLKGPLNPKQPTNHEKQHKEGTWTVSGRTVVFTAFYADFCLCPKSVIITTLNKKTQSIHQRRQQCRRRRKSNTYTCTWFLIEAGEGRTANTEMLSETALKCISMMHVCQKSACMITTCEHHIYSMWPLLLSKPGRVAQSVVHLTRKSGVLDSIPGLATYFRFSFRLFKKGSCRLLAKVSARSTG